MATQLNDTQKRAINEAISTVRKDLRKEKEKIEYDIEDIKNTHDNKIEEESKLIDKQKELENKLNFLEKYPEQIIQTYIDKLKNINKNPYQEYGNLLLDFRQYILNLTNTKNTNLKNPDWKEVDKWAEEYINKKNYISIQSDNKQIEEYKKAAISMKDKLYKQHDSLSYEIDKMYLKYDRKDYSEKRNEQKEIENKINFIDSYLDKLIQTYKEKSRNIKEDPYYDFIDYLWNITKSDFIDFETPDWKKIEKWAEEFMCNKGIKTDAEKITDVLHDYTPEEINDLTQDLYNLSERKLYIGCTKHIKEFHGLEERKVYILDDKEKIDPRYLKLNEQDYEKLREEIKYHDEKIPYTKGIEESSSQIKKGYIEFHKYKKDWGFGDSYKLEHKDMKSLETIKEILSDITDLLNNVKEKIKKENLETKYSTAFTFIDRLSETTKDILSNKEKEIQEKIENINNKIHENRLIGNDNDEETYLLKTAIEAVTKDLKKEQAESKKETYLDAKIEALNVINCYSREGYRNYNRHRGYYFEVLPDNFNDEIISYVKAFSREELNGYKTSEIRPLIEPMIEKIYEKLYPEPTKRAVEETIDILDDYIDQCNYYDDFTEPDHYDDPYDDFPNCDVWDEPTHEPDNDPDKVEAIKFAIINSKEEIIKEYNKLSKVEGYDPKKNNIYNFLKEFIEKQPHITEEKTVKLTINKEEKNISDFIEGYISNNIKNIKTEGYDTDEYHFYNDKTIIETKEENKKTLNNLDKIITSQSLSKINVTNVELKQVSRWKKISYIDPNGKKQSFTLKPNEELLLTINDRNERKISNFINDWAKIHYADLSQSQSKSLKK